MSEPQGSWRRAYALACTGDFLNVVMIEKELSGLDVPVDDWAGNIRRRELLSRTCHMARHGTDLERFVLSVSTGRAERLKELPSNVIRLTFGPSVFRDQAPTRLREGLRKSETSGG